MQSEEYENDSDTTYCSAAEDASLVESDLPSLFTTIHDKIQLHIKKQEFFNKSSVEYYLNVLSTIDNQDSLVKLAIEESSKKLQSILRSINKYEEISSNVTQDQNNFQPCVLTSKGKDLCNDIDKLKINDLTLTENCESQDYPDISDHTNSEKLTNDTVLSSIVADSFSGHEAAGCSYKDVNSNFRMYKNVTREDKVEFLERREYVLEALKKSAVPDISEAKGYIFEDPVIAEAYLDRLNFLIDSFHTSFLKFNDKLDI